MRHWCLAYGLARGLITLHISIGLLPPLEPGSPGLASLHQCSGRSRRRCPPAGQHPSGDRSEGRRTSRTARWQPADSDTGHTIGVGLQTGEAQTPCRQRSRPQPLGGPRPVAGEGSGTFSPEPGGAHLERDEGTREEDEVQLGLGPGGRDRVRGGHGSPETAVAAELRHHDGGDYLKRAKSRARNNSRR